MIRPTLSFIAFVGTALPARCTMTLALVSVMVVGSNPLLADQVIMGDRAADAISLGEDVECSGCETSPQSAIELLTSQSGGEVTAGQLWSFFKAQGVDSMDELTLHLDIDADKLPKTANGSSIDINSLQLQIEDPDHLESFVTDISIGDKQVLIPSSRQSAINPEMQLAVKLHYDFMERFTADSTEKVKLNVSTSGFLPSISIARKDNVLERLNVPVLAGFTLFWVGVFALVHWLTKPQPGAPRVASGSVKSRGRAASA